MPDSSDDPVLTPDEARHGLKITWTLLLISLPVYALVAVVIPTPKEAAGSSQWATALVFAALACGAAAAIPLIRKHFFFDPLDEGEIDEQSEEYLAELRTTSAATWALATSISILGLLAYFFVFELWFFGLFFVPSVALFFYFRPPYDLIDRMEKPAGPYQSPPQ